jgi:hypothetical protein
MAAEKISYTKDYIGTYADMATIDKTEVVPGSTYWHMIQRRHIYLRQEIGGLCNGVRKSISS